MLPSSFFQRHIRTTCLVKCALFSTFRVLILCCSSFLTLTRFKFHCLYHCMPILPLFYPWPVLCDRAASFVLQLRRASYSSMYKRDTDFSFWHIAWFPVVLRWTVCKLTAGVGCFLRPCLQLRRWLGLPNIFFLDLLMTFRSFLCFRW